MNPAHLGPPLGPGLAAALAAELVALNQALAELALDLGADIEIVRRHVTALQAVDRISQVQLGIADILRAPGPDRDRVAVVTLGDLADRLHAALPGAAD